MPSNRSTRLARRISGRPFYLVVVSVMALLAGLLAPSVAEAAQSPTHQVFVNSFNLGANKYWFWSGRRPLAGGGFESGQYEAARLAGAAGGYTLETRIEEEDIAMPSERNKEATEIWDDASKTFAEQAAGEVRMVRGDMRPSGSVWETTELPTLLANPRVTEIVQIDSITHQSIVLYHRRSDGDMVRGTAVNTGTANCETRVENAETGAVLSANSFTVQFNGTDSAVNTLNLNPDDELGVRQIAVVCELERDADTVSFPVEVTVTGYNGINGTGRTELPRRGQTVDRWTAYQNPEDETVAFEFSISAAVGFLLLSLQTDIRVVPNP